MHRLSPGRLLTGLHCKGSGLTPGSGGSRKQIRSRELGTIENTANIRSVAKSVIVTVALAGKVFDDGRRLNLTANVPVVDLPTSATPLAASHPCHSNHSTLKVAQHAVDRMALTRPKRAKWVPAFRLPFSCLRGPTLAKVYFHGGLLCKGFGVARGVERHAHSLSLGFMMLPKKD